MGPGVLNSLAAGSVSWASLLDASSVTRMTTSFADRLAPKSFCRRPLAVFSASAVLVPIGFYLTPAIALLRPSKSGLRPKLKATLAFELKVIMANLLFLEILYSFFTTELEKFRIGPKLCGPTLAEESMTNATSNLLGHPISQNSPVNP